MIPTIAEYIREYEAAGRTEMDRLASVLTEKGLDGDDLLDADTRLLVDAAARARHVANKIRKNHGVFDYEGVGDESVGLVDDEVEAILRIYAEENRRQPTDKNVEMVKYAVFQLVRAIRRDDFVAEYETKPEFTQPFLHVLNKVVTADGLKALPSDLTAEKVTKIRTRVIHYVPMRPTHSDDELRNLILRAMNELEFIDYALI